MRLLKNEITPNYQEIEVEYSFLWIKYTVKYRKVGKHIFMYKDTNRYYNIGFREHFDIIGLFSVVV